MKAKEMPKWNVWEWEFNQDMLQPYDVVPRFVCSLKALKKIQRPQTREELDHFLHGEAMYYFWAKCEWEMIIHGWPAGKNDKKVDVYEQLMLNWDHFVDFFWEKVYKPNFMKSKVRRTKEK